MNWGGRNLLITNPRDIPGLVKEISKYPVTALTGVNTLFNALLNNPDFQKLDFSTLRMSAAGGMAAAACSNPAYREKQTGGYLLECAGLIDAAVQQLESVKLASCASAGSQPMPSYW